MKKRDSLVVIAILSITLLFGCTSGENIDIELTIWKT